ncbi:MAG: hypothetical protein HZA00_03045 [Nitrospinae bacterium]|nr:hypothetical protein [Nitrospinota bacterium]
MKNKCALVLSSVLVSLLIVTSSVFAVEVAPRISDREIIEGLADIRGDIKDLRAEIKANTEAIRQLREDMNQLRKDNTEAIRQLREDMNQRFDDIRWILGLFVTISLIILGFVLRMQWQMHRRQTQVETTLETQKDEISFLKNLIEKLLPPRGVL